MGVHDKFQRSGMASVIQKPTVLQRLWRLVEGFDGPLAFAVFMLACAGLLIMYSSGFDHGTRFVDHGRNMVIAGFVMFVVAQIPPPKLMAWAVPFIPWVFYCWWQWLFLASPKRGRGVGSTSAW